jgi:hypothetical protein
MPKLGTRIGRSMLNGRMMANDMKARFRLLQILPAIWLSIGLLIIYSRPGIAAMHRGAEILFWFVAAGLSMFALLDSLGLVGKPRM